MTAERFNACEYLLDRQVADGHGEQVALTGAGGEVTYAGLLERVERTAAGLRAFGLQPEQRLLMIMSDGPEFVTVYLAAMRMGAVPVPVSTMLRVDGLAELVRDSRCRLVVATPEFVDTATLAAGSVPVLTADALFGDAADGAVHPTTADDPAFWLYTSGTTGLPKGAMHRHGSIRFSCETYGAQVLGITADDRCLSAAKAFFAYGLGNSLLFPLSVGATAILEPAPSRPDTLVERGRAFGATLFFGSPTFFANMLRADLSSDALTGVRLAASAGEALPASLYRRWTSHFGVDIIDGIGMTEMVHIFLSNRPGDVRPGTTGTAVPGYDLRILDDDGREVSPGQPGTLFVRGASTATGYFARYDVSRQVFQGEWLRTGDTYVRDDDGYYTCLGRTGDMLKASGIWVSPAEVEARLLAHDEVAQAVVVAADDADGLEKPVAYVITQPDAHPSEADLIAWCREGLPSFKRPRKVIFVDAYPTTATGKVRRVELRAMATAALTPPPVEVMVEGLQWQREDTPSWDADKQRIFGDAELASVGLARPRPDAVVADEWWRVTDGRGTVVGYGWLDSEWGDAQISFLVAPDQRGSGVGEFIVGRLELEAASRGLNYVYNKVPSAHPDPAWMTTWLTGHGFTGSADGTLRRRVGAPAEPV